MRFRDALAAPGLGAIAEIKRRSPSAGELRGDADPALLAAQFADNGAAALSVLVDDRFGGSLDDLRAARAATELPLLGKGFFTEEADLAELKAAGADAALILLRDVDDTRARALLAEARRLGLDALVEAHDAEELERAIALERRDRRGERARPRQLRDRPAHAARARRAGPARPSRRRGERGPHARARSSGGARGRERDPRRHGAHAGARPRREARRADLPPAREGLRADARRGRRGRGRRRR